MCNNIAGNIFFLLGPLIYSTITDNFMNATLPTSSNSSSSMVTISLHNIQSVSLFFIFVSFAPLLPLGMCYSITVSLYPTCEKDNSLSVSLPLTNFTQNNTSRFIHIEVNCMISSFLWEILDVFKYWL